MMKSGQYILIATFAALTITSCKKSSTPAPAKQVDVYIAGSIQAVNTLNNSGIACYWKNGIITKVSDSITAANAYAITLNNGDVYVAGSHNLASTGNGMAAYWKNGKEVDLTDGSYFASAAAIAVNNSDVYVAGSIMNSKGNMVAVYWKNGVMTQLTDGTADAGASSIAVSNGDVYMAITDGIDGKIWKNGVVTVLSRPVTSAIALSAITVQGADVYISGYDSVNGATYWKNNTPTYLTRSYSSFTSGIAVNNNGVIISGNINPLNQMSEANVWIGNNPQQLQSSYSSSNVARGLAVSGQDVYVAAQFGSYAGYWRNGVAVVLANNGTANSVALVAR